MKTLRCPLTLWCVTAATILDAQPFYSVSKNQNFIQASAAGAVSDALRPFTFEASAAAAATLTLPSGATIALVRGGTESTEYGHSAAASSAAELNAAFPSGTYRLSATGIPTLSFPLGADIYPTPTPQVVSVSNGAWSNGLLIVDPAQACTLTFSTFSNYATAGIAGHMRFDLWPVTGHEPRLDALDRATVAIGGSTQSAAPFTTYTIPAGRLRSGNAYAAELDWDIAQNVDMNSVPNGFAVTLFTKRVVFYVAAQTPGTSTPPPVIVAQPASRVAALGGSVSFEVAVAPGGGGGNVGFEWRHNGQGVSYNNSAGGKYSGSTGAILRINNLTAADAGAYAVTIVNAGGAVTSATVTLSFGTATTPVIVAQPRGATVNAGTTLALTVAATGAPAPSYQWRKDGAALAGATADTLVLANIAAAQAGNYSVVVTNAGGVVTSDTASVQVVLNQPSRLPNLSVRTNLGAGQTLIVGFATNGSKDMLVRAVGPTLGAFGVAGTLPDPTVELYNAAAVRVEENDDWSAALGRMFTEVGAFALASGSKDAALQRACNGPYSAQIKGPGAGIVLVEVYDGGGPGKLLNVSARNVVGTGENILIAGFVVDGTAAKTLLLRGVGARLAEFGVASVLADPKLEIYDSSAVKIAENDNWNFLLQPIAQSVGAFDLAPGSRDAALLMTLAPGAYTAQIAGVGGTTGEALVEVYEVP